MNLSKLFNQTKKPLYKALSLNPSVYQSKKFFNKEMDTIFKKAWIPVGYTNELIKNNVLSTNIGNKPIIITKDKNNKLKAFYNVCRHRGCKLINENKKTNLMVCPYHCWSYKLNGDLFKTPKYEPKPEENFCKSDYNLIPIPVQTFKNIITVNPNGNLSDVKDYYGGAYLDIKDYPLEDCRIIHSKKYKVNCNWKLLVDNFIEYYHLPSVHPSLTTVSGVNDHKCTQKGGKYIGFITDPLTKSGTPLDPGYIPNMPNIKKENANMSIFHALFPNQFYFLFPNHIFSIILQPISENYTIEHAVLMGHKDYINSNKEKFDEIWDFYDMVNKEDIAICEQVQEGILCDVYQGGKLVPRFESTIHRFHNMIIDHLE